MRRALNQLHARPILPRSLYPTLPRPLVAFACRTSLCYPFLCLRSRTNYGTAATATNAAEPISQHGQSLWKPPTPVSTGARDRQQRRTEFMDHLDSLDSQELDTFMERGMKERILQGRGPLHHSEREFWLEYLRYRERKNGSRGISETWRMLTENGLDLPLERKHANNLWERFLANVDILDEVTQHAVALRERLQPGDDVDFSKIYKKIIQANLILRPNEAFRQHSELFPKLRAHRNVFERMSSFLKAYPHTVSPFKAIQFDIEKGSRRKSRAARNKSSRAFTPPKPDTVAGPVFEPSTNNKQVSLDSCQQISHRKDSRMGKCNPEPILDDAQGNASSSRLQRETNESTSEGNASSKVVIGPALDSSTHNEQPPMESSQDGGSMERSRLEHGNLEPSFISAQGNTSSIYQIETNRSKLKVNSPKYTTSLRALAESRDPLYIKRQKMATNLTTENGPKITKSSLRDVLGTQASNLVLGDIHGVSLNPLPRWFTRKLCATTALSLDSIINILHLLRIESLDPQSLRELALQSQSPEDTRLIFKKLKAAGVSIGTSRFSIAVTSLAFAKNNSQAALQDLLQSDMHPDEYEDVEKQHDLLREFLVRGDRASATRTLRMLTLCRDNSTSIAAQWNVLVRTYAKNMKVDALLPLIDEMLSHGIIMTTKTLDTIFHSLVRPREHGKAVNHRLHEREYDDLTLICNIWRRVLMSNGDLPPERWGEVIKRLGQAGRLRDLRSILLWLARWYSANERGTQCAGSSKQHEHKEQADPDTPQVLDWNLSEIPVSVHISRSYDSPSTKQADADEAFKVLFPEVRLKALIQWAFKTMHLPTVGKESKVRDHSTIKTSLDSHLLPSLPGKDTRTHDHTQPSLRALLNMLQLLLDLRALGVPVRDNLVRSALSGCLWIIFGPSQSKVVVNRVISERLAIDLDGIIYEAQKVWPSRLFAIEPCVLERLRRERVRVQSLGSAVAAVTDAEWPSGQIASRGQLREDKVVVLRAVFGRYRRANMPEGMRSESGREKKALPLEISVDDWIKSLKDRNAI